MAIADITPGRPSRWGVFTAAPHRMLFLAGGVQFVLTILLWLAELLGRAGWRPVATLTIPSAWAHGFLMLYGLFPFFIFGFLLTVYPRWMGVEPVPRPRYVRIFLLLAGGMLLFYAGLFSTKPVLILGVASYLVGWALALRALLDVYRRALTRGAHELALNLALTAGVFGIAAFLAGLVTETPWLYAGAREIGLWLFLVPVVFSVSHRMIPFFGQSVLEHYPMVRPRWSLPLLGACVVGHAALETFGYARWLFLFDLPLAGLALHHTFAWNIKRSFEVRLLAMLHLAFLWFGLAMALYAAQSLLLFAGGPALPARAPLHALGAGFFAGMVLAMASRVILGHSGHALAADDLTWYCFLGVGATAAVRVLAEFWPAATQALNILAAGLWLACLLPWVLRYAPVLLRPRVDGKPG